MSERKVIIFAIIFIFVVNFFAFFLIRDINFFGCDFKTLSVVNEDLGIREIKKNHAYKFLIPENIKKHDYLLPWYAISIYKEKNFRPVSNYFLILENKIFGKNIYFYRITSAVLNIVFTILLFFLIRQIFKKYRPAFLGIAIFTLHSFNAPILTRVTEQSFQLGMIFGIISLILFIDYRHSKNLLAVLFSLIFLVLGILSREIIIIFPLIFFTYDMIFDKKEGEELSKRIARNSLFYIFSGIIMLAAISHYIHNGYGEIHGHNFISRGDQLLSHFFNSFMAYIPGFTFNIPPLKLTANHAMVIFIIFVISISLYIPAFFVKDLRSKEFNFGLSVFLISIIFILPFEPKIRLAYMALFGYSILSTAYIMRLIKKFKKRWLFRTYSIMFKIVLPVIVFFFLIKLDIKYYFSLPQTQMIQSLIKLEDKIPKGANVYLIDTKRKNAQWDLIYGVRFYSKRNDYKIYPLTNFPYKKKVAKQKRNSYKFKATDFNTLVIKSTHQNGFFYSNMDKKFIGKRVQLKQGAEFQKNTFTAIIDFVGGNNQVKTVSFNFDKPITDKNQIFLFWQKSEKTGKGTWVIKKFWFANFGKKK